MSQFLWVSLTSGKTFDLTYWADDVAFLRGASGLIGAPPVRTTNEFVPGLPGAMRRQTIHDVNLVQLPLRGLVDGHREIMDLVRKMVLVMDPVRNPEAVLRYIDDNGHPSDLFCSAVEGLEVDGLGEEGPTTQEFALGFEAVDPYWYGPEKTKRFTAGEEGTTPWFGPGLFPPLTLASGSVLGDVTLQIDSDVETWPVFTAGGPTSGNLKIENVTSKKKILLNDTAELVEDETIAIDTRPRGESAKTILGPGADDEERNWFPKAVEGGRSLWSLLPDTNKISIVMPGAESGVSFVEMKWRNATLTPVRT